MSPVIARIGIIILVLKCLVNLNKIFIFLLLKSLTYDGYVSLTFLYFHLSHLFHDEDGLSS